MDLPLRKDYPPILPIQGGHFVKENLAQNSRPSQGDSEHPATVLAGRLKHGKHVGHSQQVADFLGQID